MSEFSPFSTSLLARVRPEELKEFFSISEGWYVEYKSQPIPPKDLAKSLSSFANQYGGWLVLGVVENKVDLTAQKFSGLTHEQVANIVQTLRDSSRDCANPEIYYDHRVFDGPIAEIDLPTDKSIVVVHIPQGPEPPYVHIDARIYRRVGDSSAPKPETDQSILERLSSRAHQSRERLKHKVTRVPLTSKGEENNCYLHMTITSDPHEIGGHWFGGTFEEFSETMTRDPIPFDNLFTRAGGFVARQTSKNDPYNRVLTWEFDRHCHSFVTVPVNMLTTESSALASYDNGSSFARLVDPFPALSSRLLDLNQVFKATWAIASRHRELAGKANVYGPFYFKSYIENAWRKVPFLDMPSFLSHIRKFGLPVVQEENVLAPPGTDLKSFAVLSPYPDYFEQTADLDQEINDAVTMTMPIFGALGIPPDFLSGNGEELVAISKFRFVAPSESQ